MPKETEEEKAEKARVCLLYTSKVADLSSKEEIAIFENSKRDVEMTGIELRNSLDVIELDMNEPSLDDTMPDNERLTRALKKYMNLK